MARCRHRRHVASLRGCADLLCGLVLANNWLLRIRAFTGRDASSTEGNAYDALFDVSKLWNQISRRNAGRKCRTTIPLEQSERNTLDMADNIASVKPDPLQGKEDHIGVGSGKTVKSERLDRHSGEQTAAMAALIAQRPPLASTVGTGVLTQAPLLLLQQLNALCSFNFALHQCRDVLLSAVMQALAGPAPRRSTARAKEAGEGAPRCCMMRTHDMSCKALHLLR